MNWMQALVGLLILTMGRQLFWLFVAVVGFVYGIELAPFLFPTQPPDVLWLIALAAGLIGALLAYFFEWTAIAIAGLLVGGRVALLVTSNLIPASSGAISIPFLVGGIVGAALVVLVFDWALILLSSSIGAMLIATAIDAGPGVSLVLLGAVAVFGVIIQAGYFQRSRRLDRDHIA